MLSGLGINYLNIHHAIYRNKCKSFVKEFSFLPVCLCILDWPNKHELFYEMSNLAQIQSSELIHMKY
jgi:hypothetical protein